MFRLQATNTLGESDADTVRVNVVDDPQDKNTVTFHDLIWEQRDVYGLAEVLIFLTTSVRPDIFYSYLTFRPIDFYVKLESSSSWLSVPYRTGNLYTYDVNQPLLWIICYPNEPSLVGRKSSIKIKLL